MKRIRITATLDVTLTPEQCCGLGHLSTPEEALIFAREAAHEMGPTRFLREWGLEDDLDIDVEIVE